MKVIEVKRSIFENNDKDAASLREQLKGEKTFLLNLMSSPGSGSALTMVIAVGSALFEVPATMPFTVPSAYCLETVAHG